MKTKSTLVFFVGRCDAPVHSCVCVCVPCVVSLFGGGVL